MLLSFFVFFVVVFLSGIEINIIALLYLPLVMIIQLILALGITFLASGLTVYFRDLEHILSIVSLAWMYLSPILYPIDMVPDEFVSLYYLNPLTPIMVAYRDILYYGQVPHMDTLWNAFILGVMVLIVGKIAFGKLQRGFAEEL